MNTEQMDRIRYLLSKASSAPWRVAYSSMPSGKILAHIHSADGREIFRIESGIDPGICETEDDFEFVVEARNHLPGLLAAIEEREDWLGRMANDSDAYQMGELAGIASAIAMMMKASETITTVDELKELIGSLRSGFGSIIKPMPHDELKMRYRECLEALARVKHEMAWKRDSPELFQLSDTLQQKINKALENKT